MWCMFPAFCVLRTLREQREVAAVCRALTVCQALGRALCMCYSNPYTRLEQALLGVVQLNLIRSVYNSVGMCPHSTGRHARQSGDYMKT